MANNCLITKLKGVVDNDDLLKLDEFVFFNGMYFTMKANGGSFDVTIIGSNTFSDGTKVKTITTTQQNLELANDLKTKIKVNNKDSVGSLKLSSPCEIDIDAIKYLPNCGISFNATSYPKSVVIHGNPGDLVKNNGFNTISLGPFSYDRKFSLEELIPVTNTKVYRYSISNMTDAELIHAENEFDLFGRLLGMELVDADAVGLKGSIEGLVHTYRANGRTTCSRNFEIKLIHGTQVTFQGNTIDIQSGTQWFVLTWTENTITFNGTTINA